MKLKIAFSLTMVASLLVFEQAAQARNDRLSFPLKPALALGEGKGKVDPAIKLFFGKEKHPDAAQTFSTVKSSRKTNAVGKSDQEACNWAFLSTVIALQESARQAGGNAIVAIKSIYSHVPTENETDFVCGAGGIMAGVELEGTIVKLK